MAAGSTRTPMFPRPRTGEVRVRLGAVGMSALGLQAVGHIEAVGPEAAGFAPGDRVAYPASGETKGLRVVVSQRDLIGFPKDVPIDKAAALLPQGRVARTIVKQLHSIGRGNTVSVAPDASGLDAFVAAWVADLGGVVVDDPRADVVITASDYAVAREWRSGHGIGQQAAADVFQAVRRGVFDGIAVTSYPIAHAARAKAEQQANAAAAPVVLIPPDLTLAA